ncbi:MAG: leucine-rich repeat domain-containing protein [Porticoccaceae bacterium]
MTDDDNSKALIPRPSGELVQSNSRPGGIQARMTAGALALARRQVQLVVPKLFRISEFEILEPDYRQMQIWASALQMMPEELVAILAESVAENQIWDGERSTDAVFNVENGHIQTLVWDFDQLPLSALDTLPGLQLQSLFFKHSCPRGVLRLKIPTLNQLNCISTKLTELDLSAVPQLAELNCWGNELTELNLSAVPKLAKLYCGDNKLTKLDLSAVPRLSKLGCWENKLTDLDFSAVPELAELYCWKNELTELNLSAVPKLAKLYCWENELTELDLSAVPQLAGLNCS